MTTPKFTGYESVFDGLNALILRGTDPRNGKLSGNDGLFYVGEAR